MHVAIAPEVIRFQRNRPTPSRSSNLKLTLFVVSTLTSIGFMICAIPVGCFTACNVISPSTLHVYLGIGGGICVATIIGHVVAVKAKSTNPPTPQLPLKWSESLHPIPLTIPQQSDEPSHNERLSSVGQYDTTLTTGISSLSPELLTNIFGFLQPCDRTRAATVCRMFWDINQSDNEYWNRVCADSNFLPLLGENPYSTFLRYQSTWFAPQSSFRIVEKRPIPQHQQALLQHRPCAIHLLHSNLLVMGIDNELRFWNLDTKCHFKTVTLPAEDSISALDANGNILTVTTHDHVYTLAAA